MVNDVKKVLIVEDELIIAKDLSDILTQEGFICKYNIYTFEAAKELIENEHFDLVLIDIMLKRAPDGIKLGKYLHEKKSIPFIFITSLFDKNTLFEVKQTQPFGYIVKPFRPQDVISCVEIALNNFKHVSIDINKKNAIPLENEVPVILKRVVTFIKQNINENITLDMIAEVTRWQKHHLIRLFRDHLKITPHQYILHLKIEKAVALLEKGELQATEIAYELGFNSYSNFSKHFKRIKGMSIEEYKKKIRLKKELD